MPDLPILFARIPDLVFLGPLIIAVSLVYSATRHEPMSVILWHALRVGAWMVGFMAVVLAVLFFISWQA